MISPDGATAASASEDRTVRVWHLASGKMLCKLPLPNERASPRSISFSSNGRLLACACERTVSIWEVRDLSPRSGDGTPPQPTLNFESSVPLMNASFVPNHAVLIASGIETGSSAAADQ